MAILGIPSGVIVQRIGARSTMLLSDFARAPILASIPLLHSAGMLSFPLLLGLVALLGCFMPPYYASQRTILPELVGEDERMMSQGNSLIEGGTAFSALIGPALAGLLIPFIGAPNVLYVDAATYFVAFVLVLAFVPRRKALVASMRPKVLSGVRFLLGDKPLVPRGRGRRVRLLHAGGIGRASRLCLHGVRRERAHRRPLLCRCERRRSRGKPGGRDGRAQDVAAPPFRARHAGLRRAALGASVPASMASGLRRALRCNVLHAAHQRPAHRGPDFANSGRASGDGDHGGDLDQHAGRTARFCRGRTNDRALGRRPLFTAVVAEITGMAVVYGAIVLRHRDVDAVGEPATT